MEVVYIGPHEAVDVPEAGNAVARRGVPIEVDEAVAKRLLKQDTWSGLKPEAKKKGGGSK